MKFSVKTTICLVGSFALSMEAMAVTGDPTSMKHGEAPSPVTNVSNAVEHPYGAIVERNVFDLKDPPTTNSTPAEANTPPPNVTLTGIMTIFGKKQALFMVQKQSTPGKSGPAPAAQSYILTEGQRQDGLEVLEIDQKDQKVKIKNDGIVSTITFEAPKSGGPAPGGQPNPQQHMGRAGFNPNMNNPNGGSTPLPTRPIRTPDFSQFSPQGGGNPGGYNPQAGYNAGGISALGYNQGNNQITPAQNQQGMTAEQLTALAMANAQAHQAEVEAGTLPPFPPPPAALQPNQPNSSPTPSLPSPNNNLPSWGNSKTWSAPSPGH